MQPADPFQRMFAMRLGCPNIAGLKSSAEVLTRFPVGGSSSGRKFCTCPRTGCASGSYLPKLCCLHRLLCHRPHQ